MSQQWFPVEELKKLDYIGTGTSLFQAHPLGFDPADASRITSDWEYLADRKLRGLENSYPKMALGTLPHFLEFSEDYIRRSYELGCNMFRLSFEFSRLCPQADVFDETCMARYVKLLARIRANGQQPFVTMNHFTMPQRLVRCGENGLVKDGAWEHRDVLREFTFYARHVASFLKDEDKMAAAIDSADVPVQFRDKLIAEGVAQHFMSINEPAMMIFPGYLAGVFHPHKKGRLFLARQILKKLVGAHDILTNELREATRGKKILVGVGYNWQHYEGPLAFVPKVTEHYISDAFERDGTHTDFVGLQYYCRVRVPPLKQGAPGYDWSDHDEFGDIYPQGIKSALGRLHLRYPGKPIYVTEFGFSEAGDRLRPYWIAETVRNILEARNVGVPVSTVLLWTLVNNLEWHRGTSQRFGLFSEDELHRPPVVADGVVRSWQVWQALSRMATAPSSQNAGKLLMLCDRARVQYKRAGGTH
jgi:beta-glucosidase